MNRHGITMIELLILLVVGGWVVAFLATGARKANVSHRCHDAGFPDVRYAGMFEPFGPAYCVKRVNQTDSVVALERVR